MKARIEALFPNWKEKCINLQVKVFGEDISQLEALKDIDLSLDIKKYHEKRSLTANAYFHVLCHKLAEVMGISDARMKNTLVGRYGQPEYIDGEICAIKSNIPSEQMLEQEHLHCREVNGPDVDCHYYIVYRPTHLLDSKEFARLLDGTISECREQGIETLPPDEIKRMMKQYGIKDK